ncbi:lysylphosphatidylglycerol synthase transmembrane domain-containing protein [Parabacteroides sp. FAFU027]|uniref:lysylphosphatidylglycerol synthase transmembrane domain-containing protein n=1 Tax=Parabacteroides sp. FAFU027 TaxID=2922715 RepID=UPI001FAF01E7|nr:lysylphosphatidylglycerol synthase transmembrane domain-containing protein [Parabacteroides sp. FAFU027]
MTKGKITKNIFFLIAVVAIVLIVWKIGFDTIVENILKTGWWFFPIIGIWLVVYLINAKAFHLIINDEKHNGKVSYLKSLQLTITGFALNYSTPAGMMGGMPYRALELQKIVGGHKATSSVVLYTMMHVMAHFFFWLTSILVIAFFITVSHDLSIVLTVIFIFFVGLTFLFFKGYKRGLLLKFFAFLKKQPFFKKKAAAFYEKKEAELIEIDTQISDLYLNRRKTFYYTLGLEFLGRMVNSLEVYFIIHAIGIDVTYMQAFVMVALTTLLANILFFFPMQLGPREFGYTGALKLMKIAPLVGPVGGLGIYVSLVTRIREMIWIGIGVVLMKINSK